MKFDYTKNTGQRGNTATRYVQLIPHPDGKAWDKCCKHNPDGVCCAFVRNQDSGARISKANAETRCVYGSDGNAHVAKDVPFMCCHRSTDDGFYRVCAGWDAVFGNKSPNHGE